MEPEGSLLCSKRPTACTYPKPDQYSPDPQLFLEDPLLFYPPNSVWVFQE
jgi:hypothetical protein